MGYREIKSGWDLWKSESGPEKQIGNIP